MTGNGQGKRRRWPWWAKGLIGVVCVILLAVAGALVLAWRGEVAWERAVAELKASGEPVTFAEIEATRGAIPDEENGAILLEQNIDELAGLEVPELPLACAFDQRPGDASESTSAEALASVRAFVVAHRPLLIGLKRCAIGRPVGSRALETKQG